MATGLSRRQRAAPQPVPPSGLASQAVGFWKDISNRLPPQPAGAKPITRVRVMGTKVWAVEHTTGIVYRSEDSGEMFSAIQTGLPNIFELIFFDELNGVAVSSSKCARTSDGGLTWNTPVTIGSYVTSAGFATPLIGYAGANGGVLYRTADGGAHWGKKFLSVSCCDILDLAFPDPDTPDTGYVVIANTGSTLFKTTDGGTTWNAVSYQTKNSWAGTMGAFDFLTPAAGWAVGDFGGIFQFKDGLWKQQVSHAPLTQFDEQVTLSGVSFIPDGLTGWVVGDYATILHTTDGGQTWSQEGQELNLPSTGITRSMLTGIAAVSATRAFASGDPARAVGDTRRLFLYSVPEYSRHLYLPLIQR